MIRLALKEELGHVSHFPRFLTLTILAGPSLGADVTVATNDGWTPVFVSARMGHWEVAEALSALGASVATPTNDGWTPVFAAAGNDRLEVMKTRVSLIANVSSANNEGLTLLHAAAGCPSPAVSAFLLASGADACAR
jgi:ankyrin repeat protein